MGGEIGLSSRVSGEFEPSDSSRVKGVLNSVNQLEAKQAKMKTRAIRGYVKCTTTALEPEKGYTKRGNKVEMNVTGHESPRPRGTYQSRGGGTPIHYLYGYVPPNGVVILKLLI